MTSAGDRVEIRVGAVTDYRPRIRNNLANEELSKENIIESGIAFQQILLKSYLKKKYVEVLNQLKITGNCKFVKDNEQSYFLLPSYAFL